MPSYEGLLPFQFLTSSKLAVGLFAVASLFLAYGCLLLYRAYLHPLSTFPGPRIAGATRWYETYFELLVGEGGQFFKEVNRLHELYGIESLETIHSKHFWTHDP